MTGYLQARQSEPWTRNALRGAHTVTFVEVARVEQSAKLTASQLYAVIQKEVLANTTKMVVMLPMLADVVTNIASLVYHRKNAWWI